MSASNVSVIFDAPGPRGRVLSRIIGVVGILLCLVLGGVALYLLRKQILHWDYWQVFLEPLSWTEFILPGLWSTLKAAALAVLLSGIFGLIFGIMRLSHLKAVSIPAAIVVEFFRAVPVLMMMLLGYYFLLYNPGIVAPDQMAFAGVVVGLMFYNGSVIAELVRSGVHSLPTGQREAGAAIGLTRGQTLNSVLLPQAITAMLPSLLSQLVVVLKDTALGYIITYPDLLRSVQNLFPSGGVMVALLFAATVYIILNYALTLFASWVERRMRVRRAGKSVGVGTVPVPGTANTNIRPEA
ncbi:amino acid ABC transporter permease [Tessaracoccus sp. SD287]|uniref:amino acid ABC transporter permease n=1 Tax=Tessaracoccus sp. SD287 TaxID=2782008 RepID=UPI001A9696A8|nr:amino acid ABC transporter permease [Tessaracoccus sp. SD287]MBO1029855.1 amino acid ABC transporter permease [Tessaracoccus sp. SD287]